MMMTSGPLLAKSISPYPCGEGRLVRRGSVLSTVLMDSHKDSAQVGRLEVVGRGGRRRWSEDEKLKIVLESLEAPRRISATARRYGIARSLLLQWRRLFRVEQ